MSEHTLAVVSDVPDASPKKRVADLLAAVRAHRAEFEAGGALAEEMRTLPPSTVSSLRSLGLFWLKTPAEFGGTPLTPIEFCDVLEVIDTWHVAGLQGTGSLDFRLSDLFVPSSMTYVRGGPAVRGGALFKQPGHLFVDNEVPPLAIGLARRALADIAALAGQTTRLPGGVTLAERAAFHKDLGRAWIRVRAARAAHREAIAAAWAVTAANGEVPTALLTAATTASVYAVETCADVVTDLFRYGGGRALSLSSPLQRHLRDALAARQHVSVSEEHYETAGRELLQSRKAAAQVE